MNGTSLEELYQMEAEKDVYNNMQKSQNEISHNDASRIQQAQHNPYYGHPQPDNNSIAELSKNINDNLPLLDTYEQMPNEYFQEDPNTPSGTPAPPRAPAPSSPLSFIPPDWRDPLLILVIFIILSQPAIRDGFGKYIKYINCDENGRVPFIGVLIYGIILVSIFMLSKKFIF